MVYYDKNEVMSKSPKEEKNWCSDELFDIQLYGALIIIKFTKTLQYKNIFKIVWYIIKWLSEI